MMNEMKEQIIAGLKKAGEAGEVTADQVREIVKEAVAKTAGSAKEGAATLSEIAKEATSTGIREIEKAGEATKERITAVVEGAVDGIKGTEEKALDTIEQELERLKARRREEEEKLTRNIRAALQGSKEAADAFSGEAKEKIKTAVTDVKLKSAEILGLTGETVKQAVKRAIEDKKDVEQTVARITKDATERALTGVRFSAERVKKVSDTVLAASLEAAEEAGNYIKDVGQGAVEGTRAGITTVVEGAKDALSASGDKVKAFVLEDIVRTKEDLEAIEDLFLESIQRAARRSGEVGKETLNELADKGRETTSDLKEKVGKAAETAAQRLKERGKDAATKAADITKKTAQAAAEEAKELSKRALEVSKGALSGMWKGAKEALKKEGDE